jgi:hypothetical protein
MGTGEIELELDQDGKARLRIDDRIMDAGLAILIARLISKEAEASATGRWSLASAIECGALY